MPDTSSAASGERMPAGGFVAPPASVDLIARVSDYARTSRPEHAVVMGGFGAGKSVALAQAADAARAAGLPVAWLERGPIGISSYGDFLAAVAKAIRPAPWPRGEVEMWRREYADDVGKLERRALTNSPLVIVVESLDRLLHQVRAPDRPRIVRLLGAAKGGPLVLGSVHGGALRAELGATVSFLAAAPLASIHDGIAFAMQHGSELGIVDPGAPQRLAVEAQHLHPTLASNWLFWSLVGRYLVFSRRDPLVRAEEELRARAASHFDGMLVSLAPSEQRILVELAESGSARSVGELADAIGVRNQAAATALSRLAADDWVKIVDDVPVGADKRRTWYDIADPMLRWHLLPVGEGSVGELILAVREAWWGASRASVYGVMDAAPLDDADESARQRGGAGDSVAARSWFEFAFVERVVREGMRAEGSIEALLEYGVWVGESGDRARAVQILDAVAAEAHAAAGSGSALTLSARNAAAWNVLSRGDLESAVSRFRDVVATAPQPGDVRAADQVARAQQDLGQALGDLGSPDLAVEQMILAVQRTEELLAQCGPQDKRELQRALRQRRHGLYHWMARQPGRLDEALEGLGELARDPAASAHDRFAVRLEALELQLDARVDVALGGALLKLATEIEESDASSDDLVVAARARRRALEVYMDTEGAAAWPISRVDGGVLGQLFTERLRDDRVTLEDVDRSIKSASLEQLRQLAASSALRDGSPGASSALVELVSRNVVHEPEHRLMSDLSSALSEADTTGSPLPLEWREVGS